MNTTRLILFNLWYYLKQPPWDTGVSPPELLAFLEGRLPGRALDLGCGTGTNAITLAKHGWQATGVDFAWKAIHLARLKAKNAGVQADFRVGDVTRLRGVSGPFDLILDMGCFHSLPPEERAAYRDNLSRLLAPGGTFMLYTFLKETGQAGRGVEEAEIERIHSGLNIISRQEGRDRAASLRSAWLTYEKG